MRHPETRQPDRPLRRGDVEARPVVDRHVHHLARRPQVQPVRQRQVVLRPAPLLVRGPDTDQPVRAVVRERAEQEHVHRAEDGAVGRDAHGQGDRGEGVDQRGVAQSAEGVADVLDESVHCVVSGGLWGEAVFALRPGSEAGFVAGGPG